MRAEPKPGRPGRLIGFRRIAVDRCNGQQVRSGMQVRPQAGEAGILKIVSLERFASIDVEGETVIRGRDHDGILGCSLENDLFTKVDRSSGSALGRLRIVPDPFGPPPRRTGGRAQIFSEAEINIGGRRIVPDAGHARKRVQELLRGEAADGRTGKHVMVLIELF